MTQNHTVARTIDHGVQLGTIAEGLIAHVRSSLLAETMIAAPGQGISEHQHGKSLYFAQNAHLTLEGRTYTMDGAFYALIPEQVPHGWQHAGGEGDAVIASFEPGHRTYELYQLGR